MVALTELPSGIIQEFLGHISPDFSLSSLALVSSSWLPLARKQDPRFSCIRLRSNNLANFLHLLRSPFCSFPQHVRQLYIDWSLETIPPCAQEIIFAIINNQPTRSDMSATRTTNSKSILVKVKESMLNIRPPTAKECHALNVVCLFPNLEHLQVQLMGIKSSIPVFDAQPRTSTSLNSLSVICNSAPLKQPGMPYEWKHFLKWVRSNDICGVKYLYLTCMGSWNYEGAEALAKIQGTSLKHLHLGPQRSASQYSDLPAPPKILDLCASLNSLHLEIINTGMSQIAADTISAIPPKTLVLLGLDIQPALIRDVVEMDNLKRLSRALKKRGFTKLRGIRVRLEYDLPKYSFKEAVRILREIFPKKLLKVEGLPHERRHLVRDVTDDCYWPAT